MAEAMRLKILDLNLWMLPPPFSADNMKRLERFIAMANRMQPDIITLQELWLNTYVDYIHRKLPGYRLYRHTDRALNRSGLVIFSKKKAVAWHFHAFRKDKEGIVERFASKGYLRITVGLGRERYNIVNTHLFCPVPDRKKLKITEMQFRLLERISAKGLNIDKPLFEELNKGRFIYSKARTDTVSKDNRYDNLRLNRFTRTGQRLDYTLLRGLDGNVRKITTRIIKKPLLSDHYALLSSIEIGR